MSIKIEFAGDQPEKREVKTYTGDITKWPDGVYQWDGNIVVVKKQHAYSIDTFAPWAGSNHTSGKWCRISDNPTIASITFAGTMNYPDGKPDDVGESDRIEAACEEMRRVSDEQFALSQLSEPTDLKKGDWIQGEYSKKYFQVTEVLGTEFRTSCDDIWDMNGEAYTVVPAPEGGA